MAIEIAEIDLTEGIRSLPVLKGTGELRVLVRKGITVLGWLPLQTFGAPTIPRHVIIEKLGEHLGQNLGDQWCREALFPQDQHKKQPVSVIICTRNRPELLSRCLEVLVTFTDSSDEILVVDNAPDTDDTKVIATQYKVGYILERTPGLDRARNAGILRASHEIVAFVDDDAVVDRHWLKAIRHIYSDPVIWAASGCVAPISLATEAQRIFEDGYGGMSHGYRPKLYHRQSLKSKEITWSSAMGIGANMAFRKDVFNQVGYFDPALDVGTPTGGGGDIEIFHRIVAKGFAMKYDPRMLVWHLHREDMKGLKKQVFGNGTGFGAYLLRSTENGTASRWTAFSFFLREWLWKWNLKNLLSTRPSFPRALAWTELKGMLQSRRLYRKSKAIANK